MGSTLCSSTSSLKTIGSLLLGVTLFILYAQKCRFCKAPVEVVAKKVIIFFQNNVVSSILIIINTSNFAILVLFLLYANFSKKMPGGSEFAFPPCNLLSEACLLKGSELPQN